MGPNVANLWRCTLSEYEENRVRENLKRRGWELYKVHNGINGYVIAEVSIIPREKGADRYQSSFYKVVIDGRTCDCVEFDFWGYRTNGIKILERPDKKLFKLTDPCFDIKFVLTNNGEKNQYILVTYRVQDEEKKVEKIYVNLYNFSQSPTTSCGGRGFTFEGYRKDLSLNSVEVRLLDFNEEISYLFLVKKDSRVYGDALFDPNGYIEYHDYIWNTSAYYKSSILLNESDNLIEVAENIHREVLKEIQEERDYNW